MANRNSADQNYSNEADGFKLAGGTTKRELSVTGADVVLTGSGVNVYTFPNISGTIALMERVYPVGSIYFSVNSTNPATSLGFGTWSAFGAGRVPVGFDSGQTEFDTDEETGGAKTHTLVSGEIPAHNHAISVRHVDTTTTTGSSKRVNNVQESTGGSGGTLTNTATDNNTGGGGAHNNLQPYIVVRMWKRTA